MRRPWLFLFLLLSACSSLTSAWRDPADNGVAVQHIVILAILKDDTVSRFVEDEAARQMPKTPHAESGHAIGIKPYMDQAEVRNKLDKAGFDAAVITRVVPVDETGVYQPPETYFESSHSAFSPYYRSFWNFYSFASATAYSISYGNRDKRYVVETILYRLPDGKPIGSATREIIDPASTLVITHEVTGLISKQLQRTGSTGAQ